MPLFKKRDVKKPSEFPELPSLPTFPEAPVARTSLPELPGKEGMTLFPEIPNEPVRHLIPFSTPLIREIEPREEIKEPIFVKISRYKEALSSFEVLRKKIHETSEILEKIRELKQQEDNQIEEWQRELETIKEKLNSIDTKLFLNL